MQKLCHKPEKELGHIMRNSGRYGPLHLVIWDKTVGEKDDKERDGHPGWKKLAFIVREARNVVKKI